MRTRSFAILMILASILFGASASAAPVPVRYKEGLLHGFLVLSTLDGDRLAEGDLTEVPHGNRITSRLIFRFKDGSRQEETVIFSQHRYFRIVSYHLVQKGPAFPHATEVSIEPSTGQTTVRYTDSDGTEKTESERLKLPPDLANGLVLTVLKNLPPDSPPIELSMVVPTPKPRLVKLKISTPVKDPFYLAGVQREAQHYVIKVEIGGIAGLVAPLLGKQPPDGHIWIEGGESPTFVKSESISFLGGPVWRVELVAPTWPKAAPAEPKNGSTEKH
ncbi:MAG TPA: hypothetical protein VGK96_19890 [Candidatus Sulfotelmatobacter sp.]